MKKICTHVKDGDLLKNDTFMEMISKPRYVCTRCGCVAARKKALCHPEKIKL